MNTAVRDGVLGRSPCDGVELTRPGPTAEMRVITPAEIVRLAIAIHPRYEAVIYLAAYAGLRWGELAALRPERIDLQRGSIEVCQSLADVSRALITQPPKSGKSRSVGLPRFLRDMLADHLGEFYSENYVFTSPMGEPLRRSNWYRRDFKPAVIASGVDPSLSFHHLRSTCVALAVAEGAHPKAVQERLGHGSIRITLDTYGELFPSLDERLRDDLDRARIEALAASARPEPQIVVPFEPRKRTEPPAEQGVHVERTTRFEPATLTLARYADVFR
jgi:integrase